MMCRTITKIVLSMNYVSCVHLYTIIGIWVVFFSSYFSVIRNHLLQLHLLTSGAFKKAPGLEKLLFVIFCFNSRIKYFLISFLGITLYWGMWRAYKGKSIELLTLRDSSVSRVNRTFMQSRKQMSS